jgi:glucokinase
MNILSADIGATNSRFARFSAQENGPIKIHNTWWFKTEDFSSFHDMMGEIRKIPLELDMLDMAVISVAGPVKKGYYSNPPFISWDIDISHVEKDYSIKRCLLINDFVAQAYACRSPVGEAAEQVLPGEADPDGTVAVIGAGSNLGKSALVRDERGNYLALPSEGGHSSFTFESREEFEFHDFLLNKLGHKYVTANKVVSGQGLSHIHNFLTGEECEPQEVTSQFTLESRTLQWSARFYGRACRNYALEIMAAGGLFIAGGVAAKAPQLVKHHAFEAEFRSSSTMADLLMKIPVYLIKNEESGLWGAAFLGLQKLKGI